MHKTAEDPSEAPTTTTSEGLAPHASTGMTQSRQADVLPHGRPCIQLLAVSAATADDAVGADRSACEDVEDAVRRWTGALEPTDADASSGSHEKRTKATNLAKALRERYAHTWTVDDLEARICAIRRALDVSTRPEDLLELCDALNDRYFRFFDPRNVDEWIFFTRAALGALPQELPIYIRALRSLGCALRTRFEHFSNQEDMQTALTLHEDAFNLSKQYEVDVSESISEFATSLRRKHEKSSDIDALSQAIEYQRDLLNTPTPVGSDILHYNLSQTLLVRGLIIASNDDLNEAKTSLAKVVALRPPGHPYRHEALNSLAGIHGRMAELNEAIPMFHEVLSLRPPGHPERAWTLMLLAMTLQERYYRSLATEDLECAREYAQQAFELRPQHKSMLFRPEQILINYGAIIYQSFLFLGDLLYLDCAINAYRESLSYIGLHDPWRCAPVVNLSHALRDRYLVTHDIRYHKESLAILHEALRTSAPGQVGFSALVYGLAAANRTHFEERKSEVPYDVDEVINWLRLTGADSGKAVPLGYTLRGELSDTYEARFRIYKHLPSLDEAIRLGQQRLTELDVRRSQQRLAMASVARKFRLRFEHCGDTKYAEDSLELLLQILQMFTGGAQRTRALVMFELARLYMNPRASFYSLDKALTYLIEFIELQTSQPLRRLHDVMTTFAQLDIFALSVPPGTLEKFLLAYQLALSLLPRIAYFGLGRQLQLQGLRDVDSCAIAAAGYAIRLTKCDVALEVLEEGRAVFWQQYLRLRTAFNDLPENLATVLLETATALEQEQGDDEEDDKRRHEANLIARRQMGERFQSLLMEARNLPGFEQFLLPGRYTSIRAAAMYGPVAVLVAGELDSYVILLPDTVSGATHICLSGVSKALLRRYHRTVTSENITRSGGHPTRALRKRSSSVILRLVNVIEDLWSKVMHPVIQQLQLRVRDLSQPSTRLN